MDHAAYALDELLPAACPTRRCRRVLEGEAQDLVLAAAWLAKQRQFTLPGDVTHDTRAPAVVENDLGSAETIASGESSVAERQTSVPAVRTNVFDLSTTVDGERYERIEMLGAGGMGEVWLHRDRRIGRRVAVKTLGGEGSSIGRERFLREVRVQGQLEHPAIVPVYDLDVDPDGRTFFTMKRVRGETLETIIARIAEGDSAYQKKFSLRRLLSAFAQVCLTVDYAHTRGVLHRDLKPGNIMLGDFGEVYVLDWGLAKLVGEPDLVDGDAAVPEGARVLDSPSALTVNGSLLGTPAYMAPEQLRSGQLDRRTDVYSLGVILYEILTHKRLRPQTSFGELVLAVAEGTPVHPADDAPGVPPELDALCTRALAHEPDDRLATARELSESIERYLDGDRDLLLRRELAARHVASAEKRKDQPATKDETPRLEAMREVMKALALDGDNADAQRLIVELVVGASDEVPVAALPELAALDDEQRAQGAKWGMFGLLSWLTMFPAAIVVGVRSWPQVSLTAVSTLLGAGLTYHLWRTRRYGLPATITLSVLCAIVTASVSCYLGPFALVPTVAATTTLLCALFYSKKERWIASGVTVVGAAVPFVVDMFSLLPGSYVFESSRLIIPERAIALPRGPTMLVMLYSTLSFVILTSIVVGRVRDSLRESERRTSSKPGTCESSSPERLRRDPELHPALRRKWSACTPDLNRCVDRSSRCRALERP